jgi:hypothetical protein
MAGSDWAKAILAHNIKIEMLLMIFFMLIDLALTKVLIINLQYIKHWFF